MNIGTLDPHKAKRRWKVVLVWENNQQAPLRSIATQTKESASFCYRWIQRYKQTRDVKDGFKSGRKRKLTEDILVAAQELGAQKSVGTSRRVAARLQAEHGVTVSPRTVRRNFSDRGLVWEGPKQRPMLTALQKQKRLHWSQKHLRSKTSFSGWMFTDSKLFLLNRTRGKAVIKVWHPRGKKPAEAVAKASLGIHVYLGVCKHGLTKLVLVTGGGGKVSEYMDPRTKKPRPGVCAQEYIDRPIPSFLACGDRLFDNDKRWAHKWMLQQDGATVHTTKVTKAKLHACMKDRVVWDWPPNSPDLSWIENIWAWAEEQVQRSSEAITSVAQLEKHVAEVLSTIPAETFINYVKGMKRRLQAVVAANGDSISK